MGRGDSYDKYLARLDAADAARARARDEKAAAREARKMEWSRVLQDFVDRVSALGLEPVELPTRRPVKLPITRRPRGTKSTRVGEIPRLIDREVVEQPSGVRGWATGAHIPAFRGDEPVHHPIYVSTDARVVAPTRLERLADGPAVHGGHQVQWYSPGWRFIEPPQAVEVRATTEAEQGWSTVPFREHLADFLDAVERGDHPGGTDG